VTVSSLYPYNIFLKPMSLLASYRALKSNDQDDRIAQVLQSIINASPMSLDNSQRQELVNELFNDVRDPTRRLTKKYIPRALLAIKTLGRIESGSVTIVQSKNLGLLLSLIKQLRTDPQPAIEAMKCVANALLLIASARDDWVSIHGGEACVQVLQNSQSAEETFLAARILFLATAKESPFLRTLVEDLNIVDLLGSCYETSMTAVLSSQPFAKDALTDLLKVSFNVLLLYPRVIESDASEKGKAKERRVIGDLWNDRLANLLSPLLRLFNTLPPTAPSPLAPPLTHVIHSLINIPIAPFASKWFSRSSPPPASGSTESGSSGSPKQLIEPLNKALSFINPSRRSSSSSRAGSPSPVHDTVQRAYDLFDLTSAHFAPGDPDDPAVRDLCKKEDVALDDLLSPLVVLLNRLASGDANAKLRLRNWIIPPDVDRTNPLEEREDLLGRCLRFMRSVYFTQLKDCIGELLFTLCDSDATTLCSQIGYGNAAGYLFNKGIMAPPPPDSASAHIVDEHEESINPITGLKVDPNASNPLDSMTDEEKEREAERLFVLFDRLEKSGMGVTNPIRKAIQEGKISFP